MEISTESHLKWLALKCVPRVGNRLYKRLIDRFHTPEEVFKASEDSLLQVEGIYREIAKAIRSFKIPSSVNDDLSIAKSNNISVVTMADEQYPKILLEIPDPPPVLYVYGRIESNPGIAIVGSRTPTHYGLSTTTQFSKALAQQGFTIVSGMARGIDTAAHEGALSVDRPTIAVLGCGLSVIYPPENKELFHRIAKKGAVISEFPMSTKPDTYNFPQRNRIISGMSYGTIVIEAGAKSGSLITARLALEQNRQVFAVPGNITSGRSLGTNNLIKQGAKLVENAQDVLEDIIPMLYEPSQKKGELKKFNLSVSANQQNPQNQQNQQLELPKLLPSLSPDEEKVWQIVPREPVHIDTIVRQLNMELPRLSTVLLELELKGLVYQSPGKLFSKSEEY